MNSPGGDEDQPQHDHGVPHARVSRQALDAHVAVRGEGDEWDFKATLGDLTTAASRVTLAKDALAFANLPEGGTIIVGVANDFTRVGLGDAEHLDTTAIRLAIEKYIDGDFVVVAAEHVVAEEGEELKRFGIVHFSRRSLQPVIAAKDGQFSSGRPLEFRKGDILVRRGAASTRANTGDVRRLLTSSVVSQERMDAAKELWAAVVGLRELLGGVETLFDILTADEYSDVPGNPNLRAYVTEETEFEIATKASEIGRRVRLLRPLLPDGCTSPIGSTARSLGGFSSKWSGRYGRTSSGRGRSVKTGQWTNTCARSLHDYLALLNCRRSGREERFAPLSRSGRDRTGPLRGNSGRAERACLSALSDPSWLVRLVRRFAAVADGVEQGLLLCGDGGWEGLGGAGDGDRR